MSAIRVFLMYCDYRQFRRDMKPRPLFGRSPLFGVSVKRDFTVARNMVKKLHFANIICVYY